MKRRRKMMAIAAVVAVAASGCQVVDLAVGEKVTTSCPENSTMAYGYWGEDMNKAVTLCGDDQDTKTVHTCYEGALEVTKLSATSVEASCEPKVPTTVGDPIGSEAEPLSGEPATDLWTTFLLDRGIVAHAAAAGDGCWRARPSAIDRHGARPDESDDALNWRIITTVEWCVYQGIVQCGMYVADVVHEGRMHEVGPGRQLWVSPCTARSRTIDIDWDLRFGWCPWCMNIDVDLHMTVTVYGHYYGKYRWNGEGI